MTASSRRFGASYDAGKTAFALWAPSQDRVRLMLEGHPPVEMTRDAGGWHAVTLRLGPGTEYQFAIGETAIADPASRKQSARVRGWSVVTDPNAYRFSAGWKGRPWEEVVIYELHPGLCGGFKGIVDMLPALAETGFTAVELMPIAQFPGAWNWGYDGAGLVTSTSGLRPFGPKRRRLAGRPGRWFRRTRAPGGRAERKSSQPRRVRVAAHSGY